MNPDPILGILPLVAAFISAITYFGLAGYKKRVGLKIGSQSLVADSKHSIVDVYAGIIVFTGIVLGIHFLPLFPLLIFCFYILYQTGANLKTPSEQRTFRIFKIASMFMAFAFLPQFRPCRIILFMSLSTMLTLDFSNRWCSCLPPVCGKYTGFSRMYFFSPRSWTSTSSNVHFPNN